MLAAMGYASPATSPMRTRPGSRSTTHGCKTNRTIAPRWTIERRLLAELQENNARKELTGAERKAFAAEVGRICLKLREMSSKSDLSNLDKSWLMDIVEKTGQARSTVNNWWSAFCRESGKKNRWRESQRHR